MEPSRIWVGLESSTRLKVSGATTTSVISGLEYGYRSKVAGGRIFRMQEEAMKWWVAGAFVLLAIAVDAQVPPAKLAIATDEDYSKAMKEIAAQNGALRKSLTSSDADAAAAAARLETVFKDVQAYW